MDMQVEIWSLGSCSCVVWYIWEAMNKLHMYHTDGLHMKIHIWKISIPFLLLPQITLIFSFQENTFALHSCYWDGGERAILSSSRLAFLTVLFWCAGYRAAERCSLLKMSILPHNTVEWYHYSKGIKYTPETKAFVFKQRAETWSAVWYTQILLTSVSRISTWEASY